MNYNDLKLKIYDGQTSTTEVQDTDRAIEQATIDSFASVYPGGLFSTARVFTARDPLATWQVQLGQRVAIYNGLEIAWEGVINAIGIGTRGDLTGTIIDCTGQWAALLEQRTWNKVWADQRLTEQAWTRQAQGDADNMANVDRLNRIGVGPQVRAWTAGDVVAAFRYTMPTGETIKRIKATLRNRENGQNWITRVYDPVGAATLFSETGDGVSTATDHTLATPRQYVEFQFVSNANQTPTIAYGRMSAVTVYSETGNINPTEIVKDVRAKITEINSDEARIGSNTFTLEPFASNGQEPIASIVRRVMSYGDAAYNSWAAYLGPSDWASVPDGKPVLCLEQYPALTDYDLVVRIGDQNLIGQPEFKRSVSEVANWIAVRYRDEAGNDITLTPDDDATLKDTASIALYGERQMVVDAGTATAASAANYAKRILAARKDTHYKATSPITVSGWILTKQGIKLPACRIRAGLRVLIENSIVDTPFLITGVEYTPASRTARITMGVPDSLAVYLAQRALLDNRRLV